MVDSAACAPEPPPRLARPLCSSRQAAASDVRPSLSPVGLSGADDATDGLILLPPGLVEKATAVGSSRAAAIVAVLRDLMLQAYTDYTLSSNFFAVCCVALPAGGSITILKAWLTFHPPAPIVPTRDSRKGGGD